MIFPKSVSEVEKYLHAPLCHESVVLFKHQPKNKSLTPLIFMLNPFGSGSCNTQELNLSANFKLKKSILKNIIIIENKDFGAK